MAFLKYVEAQIKATNEVSTALKVLVIEKLPVLWKNLLNLPRRYLYMLKAIG